MRTRHFASLLLTAAMLFILPGCTRSAAALDGRLRAVASTYPVYLLAGAVAAGADNVDLSRLNTGQVSCLHDYTLTVADARRLEEADLLLLNGAGLEEFLDSTLERLDTAVVDCSLDIPLLESNGHEHHSDNGEAHEHEHDPHYWMDPLRAAQMVYAIAEGFSKADPEHEALYQSNADAASLALRSACGGWSSTMTGLSHPYLITFHDGFHYFAQAFGLELLFAMEEEEGATASARDILTASLYVKEYNLPVVFMESNGSGSAARAVAGETGAAVFSLTMLMDGPAVPSGQSAEEIVSALYLTPMGQNIEIIAEVLS